VINTICEYLDIWCLTIKHPYVEGDGLLKPKKP
jgi:ethanolaminephosphotransferase